MKMKARKAISMETILIIFLCFDMVHGGTFTSSKAGELSDNLTSGYYKDIRPCVGCGTPLVLNVTYHMTYLNYLDEVAGEMSSIGYLTVKWLDSRLAWNPLDYEGIVTMVMPVEKIWLPTLLVANPSKAVATLSKDFALPRLIYNGLVIWTPGDVFQTRCNADISRYPFDKQECYLSFMTWGYLPDEIAFHLPYNDNPLPFYVDNGRWVLKETHTSSNTQNSINIIRFFYTFQRRPQYFVVNVLLPIILLGFLNCLVFVIPADAGERVSYSITVSLSFAVFMSLVGDNIPQTSDPMALLSYFLFSVFAMSAVIMIVTIFNTRLFKRDPGIPVPGRYKTLVAMVKYRFKRNTKVVPGSKKGVTMVKPSNDERKDVKGNGEHGVGTSEGESTVTWIEVSECLDAVCAVVFLSIFIVTTVVQLVVIYVSPD